MINELRFKFNVAFEWNSMLSMHLMVVVYYVPGMNNRRRSIIELNSIKIIAVHFHEHLDVNPFLKFNGVE
jgi:hypothetical protein